MPRSLIRKLELEVRLPAFEHPFAICAKLPQKNGEGNTRGAPPVPTRGPTAAVCQRDDPLGPDRISSQGETTSCLHRPRTPEHDRGGESLQPDPSKGSEHGIILAMESERVEASTETKHIPPSNWRVSG